MPAEENPHRAAARKRSGLDVVSVLGRWLLGGLFIYTGLQKALHPELFLKLVHQYDLPLSPFLLNSVAAGLPWFEVVCGILLVTGVAVRGAGLMLVLMLVPFTLVVLKRALAIAGAQHLAFCAVKFNCGCGTGEVLICHKLVENCLMILLACWLLLGRGRQFSLRYSLLASGRLRAADKASSPGCGVAAR